MCGSAYWCKFKCELDCVYESDHCEKEQLVNISEEVRAQNAKKIQFLLSNP